MAAHQCSRILIQALGWELPYSHIRFMEYRELLQFKPKSELL